MAKEFLLVDGYNIIHAWSELRELVEDVSLESARQRLMDILSNYKGTKQATVILVFDGYLVKGNIGTVYEYDQYFRSLYQGSGNRRPLYRACRNLYAEAL